MDNQKTAVQQVVEILKTEKGYSDDQVADFLANLSKTAFTKLYGDAMTSFSDEEMQAIDAAKTQQEADAKIRELYTTHIGKDPDQEVQEFIEGFAKNFLTLHEQEKSGTTPTPTPAPTT